MEGWVVKINGYELHNNYLNTFRVENGILKVSYDQYDSFTDEFKPFDIRAMEKAFEKTLQGDNVFAFIARYQNKPIGYLFGYVKTRPDSAFQYEKRYCILTKLLLAKNIRKAESDNY